MCVIIDYNLVNLSNLFDKYNHLSSGLSYAVSAISLGEVRGRTPYRGTSGTWDIGNPPAGYEPKVSAELRG